MVMVISDVTGMPRLPSAQFSPELLNRWQTPSQIYISIYIYKIEILRGDMASPFLIFVYSLLSNK